MNLRNPSSPLVGSPHQRGVERDRFGVGRWTEARRWLLVVLGFVLFGMRSVSAASVPPGFTEITLSGSWSDAVGLTFEGNGRMYVWERTGRVWFKDPADGAFTMLLDISEEVGTWEDHGMLGFALDPNFRVNGYIYVLYAVDRYHLLNFGLPGYNPAQNQYNAATIGRLTRFTCQASGGFRSVVSGSRLVLIGETKQTGFPILSYTHGVGSLVFGADGTLLVSCGDGATASTVDQGGAVSGSYAPQGLADGIIRPKEDIGAIRSQLVDCLSGKVLRIDPASGNGLPSNPYYDAANPRSARSRVWALGLRNPFRMSLKPETGSQIPADGNPGVLYIGNVGWDTWESLKVVTGPGQNFGWPLYEGLSLTAGYDLDVNNPDAPNPAGCGGSFKFKDLLKEDTLAAAGQPPFVNPCNSALRIPSSIPQFLHTRPVLDWNHASAITRTPTYGGAGQAQIANVGAVGSPVSGTPFQGNCAVGGTWYTGTNFPAAYQDQYFFADWGQGVIKTLTCGPNDKPVALSDFASGAGAVVCIVQHPTDGTLYYISYNFTAATIRQLIFKGNRAPIAAASADRYYGVTPLAVQFSSSGSIDPDGGPLTYSWNFGDGSATSPLANPSHTFSAAAGAPTKFVATLTVTDSGGLSAQTTLIVAGNDTPPNVTITSPVDGSLISPNTSTMVNLTATVSDGESGDGQLVYQWQTLFHHNDHNHSSPVDTNHVSTTVLSPSGCDGINIYYSRILLTVTDPQGLATTREVRLFPDCGPNTPATISGIASQTVNQDRPTGPLAFTVGDAEVSPANLQLSGSSSDPLLVPVNNINFGGSGANRTVTVTPGLGRTGTATITVTVNDGPNNTSTSFGLTVNPAPSGTGSFTNPTPVGIPDSGAGSPYPSYLNVTGMGGTVTNVTVTLKGFNHSYGNDVDVLLVGPGGQKLTLLSDAGVGPVTPGDFTFSDAAAGMLPQVGSLVGGTYKPTDYPPATTYPAPAPAGPYATALSTFNGTVANGWWALYVFDDGAGDSGSLAGGWRLTVTTASTTGAAPTISDITDQAVTVNGATSAIGFTVGDADTSVASLTLSKASSNSALVPTNNIVFGGGGANRTVTVTPVANQTGVATITVGVGDGVNSASDTFVLTVNPAQLTITIDPASRLYGGANPAFSGSLAGVQAGDVISATYSSAANALSPVGAQAIRATLIDPGNKLAHYAVVTNGALLTITAAPLAVSADNKARAYGAPNPQLTGTLSGLVNGDAISASYTTAATPLSPVGSYAITPVLADPGGRLANYTLSTTAGTLSISPAPLVGTADAKSRAYGAPNPLFTVSYSGFVNGQNASIVTGTLAGVSPADTGSAPGLYPISVSGQSAANYAISYVDGVLTVTPGQLTIAIDAASRVYGGANPAFSGSLAGVQDGDVISAAYSSAANALSPVGAQAIRATLIDPGNKLGRYTVVTNGALLTITPAPLTVSADNKARAYGASNPPLTGTLSGLVNGDAISASYTTAAAGLSPVGSYAITPVLADPDGKLANYALSSTAGMLSISPAQLVGTADARSRAYGAPNPLFTVSYSGFVNGQNASIVTGMLAGVSPADTDSAPGLYPISVSGQSAPDYAISYVDGVLTVTPGQLTITIDAASRLYGGANPVFSGSLVGVQDGDVISAAYSSAANALSPVGAQGIGATLIDPGNKLGRYTVVTNGGLLTITPASLAASADNKTRVYGAVNPELTGTLSGLVNGDAISASYTTAAAGLSPVGSYSITPVLADPDGKVANYTLSSTAGTLSITPAGGVTIVLQRLQSGEARLSGTGDATVIYQLQASTDLTTWQPIGAATAAADGTFQFEDQNDSDIGTRFYRVMLLY